LAHKSREGKDDQKSQAFHAFIIFVTSSAKMTILLKTNGELIKMTILAVIK
jgi:hypothetical protein